MMYESKDSEGFSDFESSGKLWSFDWIERSDTSKESNKSLAVVSVG
ncbi:unnamed protein product [Schistosoma mattheei]|uniref:Uncharacterized protein n=1 Tax=Schistosoma mattheei TaxID=31246 RepID=A0A183PCD8_9TREM|nr:unnamed protein product [Schistosoma mattheei]